MPVERYEAKKIDLAQEEEKMERNIKKVSIFSSKNQTTTSRLKNLAIEQKTTTSRLTTMKSPVWLAQQER